MSSDAHMKWYSFHLSVAGDAKKSTSWVMFSAGLSICPVASIKTPLKRRGHWGSGNVPARPVSATPTPPHSPIFHLVVSSPCPSPTACRSTCILFRQPHRICRPLPSPSRQIRDPPFPSRYASGIMETLREAVAQPLDGTEKCKGTASSTANDGR